MKTYLKRLSYVIIRLEEFQLNYNNQYPKKIPNMEMIADIIDIEVKTL